MDLVEVQTWESFRLQIDLERKMGAAGWSRVNGRWTRSEEETSKALMGVMFTQVESYPRRRHGSGHVCTLSH